MTTSRCYVCQQPADVQYELCEVHADSALALLARQVSAAIEASHREIDAPESYPTHDARVAWADGYTKACIDIRAAIRAVE